MSSYWSSIWRVTCCFNPHRVQSVSVHQHMTWTWQTTFQSWHWDNSWHDSKSTYKELRLTRSMNQSWTVAQEPTMHYVMKRTDWMYRTGLIRKWRHLGWERYSLREREREWWNRQTQGDTSKLNNNKYTESKDTKSSEKDTDPRSAIWLWCYRWIWEVYLVNALTDTQLQMVNK